MYVYACIVYVLGKFPCDQSECKSSFTTYLNYVVHLEADHGIGARGSKTEEDARQEFWSGLPFPSPEDLPNPGIKATSPASPVLAGRFFTTEPPKPRE